MTQQSNAVGTLHDQAAQALARNLSSADNSFGRNPVAGIYHLYKEYVAAGHFPYIDAVTKYIQDNYTVDESLTKQLQHEVYLACQKARIDKDFTRAQEMLNQGYLRASENNLVEGTTYMLKRYFSGIFGEGFADEIKVRCKVSPDGRYFLMPPRCTRRGYVLSYDSEYWIKEL